MATYSGIRKQSERAESIFIKTPWLVASFMGVVTGTMGGIFRDVLCNEPPVVFLSPLYATVSRVGSLVFIGLQCTSQGRAGNARAVAGDKGITNHAVRITSSLQPRQHQNHAVMKS